MRFAAIDFLVGAAEGAQALEGLHQPEGQAGLLAPSALAHDAIRAALGKCSRSVGDVRSAHGCLGLGQIGRMTLSLADGLGLIGAATAAVQFRQGQRRTCARQGCCLQEMPA